MIESAPKTMMHRIVSRLPAASCWSLVGELRETVSLSGRLAAFIAAGRPRLAGCSRHCKVGQMSAEMPHRRPIRECERVVNSTFGGNVITD